MRRFFMTSLMIIAVIFLGYKSSYPSYRWHQKLTVVVETPDGLLTGSSVVEILVRFQPQILPDAAGVFDRKRGEAAVVDMGEGRYLFALIGDSKSLARRLYSDQLSGLSSKGAYRKITRMHGEVQVPLEHYPHLVTFGDVTDPASVLVVSPLNLEESFGEGVRLKTITLEITNERVTVGVIDELLGWLGEYPESRVRPKVDVYNDRSFEAKLRHGNFIRR